MQVARTPGIYPGISNGEYHNDKTWLSSSQLKVALNSPAMFKYFVLDGKGTKRATSSKDFGTLVHTLVLEPDTFEAEYAVLDNTHLDLRRSADKKIKEEFEVANKGKTVITKDLYDQAKVCQESVFAHPDAKRLLQGGIAEASVYWEEDWCIDEATGEFIKRQFRVRPDYLVLPDGRIIIPDLKTSKSPGMEGFRKDALSPWGYQYDLSAYMYLRGVAAALNMSLSDMLVEGRAEFWWIVVGNEEPNPTAVYKASLATLIGGKNKFEAAVRNIIQAERLQDWTFQKEWEEL